MNTRFIKCKRCGKVRRHYGKKMCEKCWRQKYNREYYLKRKRDLQHAG